MLPNEQTLRLPALEWTPFDTTVARSTAGILHKEIQCQISHSIQVLWSLFIFLCQQPNCNKQISGYFGN